MVHSTVHPYAYARAIPRTRIEAGSHHQIPLILSETQLEVNTHSRETGEGQVTSKLLVVDKGQDKMPRFKTQECLYTTSRMDGCHETKISPFHPFIIRVGHCIAVFLS